MSFRVLIADSMSSKAAEVLAASQSVQVDDRAGISRDELLSVIPDYQGLIVRSRTKVDADVIAAGEALRVVGRAGIGVDNVDLRAATRAGVVVMNTPDGNATTTAEHTLALMFAAARMVPQASASMRSGKWEKSKFMGRELTGKTLAVIGLGNIGRIVAQRAQGLSMKVVGYDPFLDADAAARYGVELLPLEGAIAAADVITVHTPLNDQTRGLIGKAQLEILRPGVILVNCARGGIYDEEALVEGLESARIGAVALDVFTTEPPPADSPLLAHERVVCTPHLGASTKEAQVQVALDIAAQIAEFAEGGPARNAINMPRITAARLKEVAPFVQLAERMGSFCEQLGEGSMQKVSVRLAGQLPDGCADMVTTAALAGALQRALARPVNFVNARVLADERGIEVVESQVSGTAGGFAHTIEVSVQCEKESHTVVGTVFGGEHGRFVKVDGIALEAVPEGELLLIHNHDQPGVVGHVGTVLGEAGINISRMHLGLSATTGKALAIVNIDGPPSAEILDTLRTDAVIWLRHVQLS